MWRARRVNASIVTPLQTTRGRFGALVVTRASPEPYTGCGDPAARDLRIAGRHRHRKCRAVQRAADAQSGSHRRAERTDRDGRSARHHRRLTGIVGETAAGDRRVRGAAVRATVANLWLLDGTDAYIAPQHKPANLAAASDVPIGRRVPIGAVALFSALRDGRSRRVDSWNDIDAEDYPCDPSQRVPAHVDRSAVYVPLHVRDEYIGMIAIFRETVRPFSDHNVGACFPPLRSRPSSRSRTRGCCANCARAIAKCTKRWRSRR